MSIYMYIFIADMHRTFPDNLYFMAVGDKNCLRQPLFNVLVALGHKNTESSYCQVTISFNSCTSDSSWLSDERTFTCGVCLVKPHHATKQTFWVSKMQYDVQQLLQLTDRLGFQRFFTIASDIMWTVQLLISLHICTSVQTELCATLLMSHWQPVI